MARKRFTALMPRRVRRFGPTPTRSSDRLLARGWSCSTPTVDGSTVYALSKHGVLHAYGAKDGKILWKKEMMKEAGMRRPPSGASRPRRTRLAIFFSSRLALLSHSTRKQVPPNGKARPFGPPMVPRLPLVAGRPT